MKKRSIKTILSLVLTAALTVGCMTSVYATDADTTSEDMGYAVEETNEVTAADITEAASEGFSDNVVSDGESMWEDSEEIYGETGISDEWETEELTEDTNAVYTDSEGRPEEEITEDEEIEITEDEEIETEDEEEEEEDDEEAEDSDYDPSYGLYGAYDGADSMNDPDRAGSSVGWDITTLSGITSASGLWRIDDYYVGEDAKYDVEKTDDFSLKYQIEFHTSEDLDVGAVQIVIDASLGTYRDGTNILPTDIGIPYGTPDNYSTSSSSPFNYYYINENGVILTAEQAKTAEGVQIVVWNYRDIVSGSNAMFQVLYKSLDVMQIPDMTTWNMGLTATVDINTNSESVKGNTLSGVVDTEVNIDSVTKKPYTASDKSYTPELYTASQVSYYINGEIPEPYASNFDDYVYVVWRVTVNGDATQPYTISFDENTTFGDGDYEGSVVGYLVDTKGQNISYSYYTDLNGDPALSFSSSTQRNISASFYVVTAYSAELYEEGSTIDNTLEVIAHAEDGKDADYTTSTSATTTWGEYVWDYDGKGGNGVGIKKYTGTSGNTSSRTYNAYETLYEINQAKGTDTGSFSYYSSSTGRGYGFTHHVVTDGSGSLGEYIDGTYYTTTVVDDALYLYPNGGTSPSRMLGKDDYYFSSVSISTTDYGYDIWEDSTSTPEAPEGVDQSVYIYAMFYEQGADADAEGWEYVGTVPFAENGRMTYTFSSGDLARQPYRVKVVHSTVNFETDCNITLGVTLRSDSPMIQWCMDEYGDSLDNLKIENLSGIAGQIYGVPGYEDGTYFQDERTSGENYSEMDTVTGETLLAFTEGLYGTVLTRDNAYVTMTSLDETAASYKAVTSENDVANSRVLENYYLTAYEAYYVTGSSTVSALKEAGISMPDRNDVAYYDLLPYGVQFNANAPVTAGRITSMNSTGSWRTNSGAWDQTGVTVTVDESDVITNWNNTGRTMVIFHIHYDGDDASAFYNVSNSDQDLWYQGFGIAFQAYYDWTDMNIVDAEYNIAAYIAENVTDASQQLLGSHGTNVFKDDGSANIGGQYEPFKISDLNGDGITDLYTNMYASTSTTTNMATASENSIQKKVRADEDAVADYGSTALVGEGNGYTYEVAVTNTSGASVSDIVVYDRLEYAVEEGRSSMETGSGSVFDGLTADEINNHWTGFFTGLTLSSLEDLGISPVVYYNENRGAAISGEDGSPSPAEVLTEANGWYEASVYAADHSGDLSGVKAIAVDMSTMKDGTAYALGEGESLSFQIHMNAPDTVETGYTYAFNNPAFYSVSADSFGDEPEISTEEGDTVRVKIGLTGTLEVEKEFAEGYEVPASMTNSNFTFVLKHGDSYLTNQEYMVYEWDDSINGWVSTGIVRSTDINGQFTLKAGQRAVFSDIVDLEDITVAELSSALWNNTESEVTSEERISHYSFENKYRSPVYLYKTALTTDLATEEELSDAQFTFLIEVDIEGDGNYVPLANSEVLYVSEALTDGSSPLVLGSTTTDENGIITIGLGDIIAFFPEDANGNTIGVSYRITEKETGDSWICEEDTVTGTTRDYGVAETISNFYKYRALILTKDLKDYDHDLDECESEWTFKITDEDGNAVTGNAWYMIDEDGNLVCDDDGEPIEGILDSNGEFTFSGAGSNSRIVVMGLTEGERYIIQEISFDDELYELINDGAADFTMPTYSITRNVTITNEYLLRNLEVQKIALTEDESVRVNRYEFTFTLTDADGAPVAGAAYTIKGGDGTVYETDENGQFIVHGNETVVFEDLGYEGDTYIVAEVPDENFPQVYPADNQPNIVSLDSDGVSAQFINGDFDSFVILTKELEGLDEVGERYKAIEDEDGWQQTLKFTGITSYPAMGYYASEIGFCIENNGECVTEDEGDIGDLGDYYYVLIYIEADGSYEIDSYNGGWIDLGIMPNDHYYIANLNEGDTLVVDESEKETNIIYPINNNFLDEVGAEYIISSGIVMHGEEGAGGTITLINGIASAEESSSIYKMMSEDSEEVSVGAQITFRVERYNASTGTWSPASGIAYIPMDGYEGDRSVAANPTGSVQTTGSDGKITLTKTENGYPYIRFTEDEVYVNVDKDMEDGQLRLVEVASETDEEWGTIVGYDREDWEDEPALDVTYGDTIYDANNLMQFEVEKVAIDAEEDDEFTFTLEHVLSTEVVPITTHSEVTESEIGKDVHYIVYDVDTGEVVGEGYTDENGQFTLKSGQYAVFDVEADSSWCIFEGAHTGYVLIDVKANSDKADNAFVVDDVVGVVMKGEERVEPGDKAFAIYSADDNSLTFYGADEVPEVGDVYNGKTVTSVYTGFDTTEYTTPDSVPWFGISESVASVTFDPSYATIQPISMAHWFYHFSNCTIWDLANTDVSQVTSLYCTFEYCARMNSLDTLANWDVSSVTTMAGAFRYCESVSSLEALSGWDVSNVTSLYATFEGCGTDEDDGYLLTSLAGLESWNVSNVTTLESTFRNCYGLTILGAISGWNVGSVTSMECTFEACTGLTNLDDLSGWNVGSVTSMYGTFRDCYGLTDISGISGWDMSSVTTMHGMFDGCVGLTTLSAISGWNVSSVTDMSYTFYNCTGLTSLGDLSGWNVGNVTTLEYAFSGCTGLIDISGLINWNAGNLTSMQCTFALCTGLTNLDGLAGWNVSSLTDLSYTFDRCSGLTSIDGLAGWNVGNVTDMTYTFNQCTSLTNLNALSDWTFNNLITLTGTFAYCSSLTNIDGTIGWNMSNVTNMASMFERCSGLTVIDVSKWNTANVQDMHSMFYGYSDLTTIYSDDDVFVTTAVTSGYWMFNSCSKLVGGNGTKYSSSNVSASYAHVDVDGNPGYFTNVEEKP